MDTASVLEFAKTFGAPVAICLAMLFAFGKWIIRQDEKADKRDDSHKAERKEDRDAHIQALREITGKFDIHTQTLQEHTESIKDLTREIRDPPRRAG